MPVLMLRWILQLRVISTLKLTLFFRQSVSFRFVFASLDFLLVYCFYVVFSTSLPFIFFSSVFEGFDGPHSGSP